MSYEPYYEGGWQSGENGGTPITPEALNHMEEGIKNAPLHSYPVGAIYISTVSDSPASLFGGTWEQITDKFLLAAGSSYVAGVTGGSSVTKHSHLAPVGISNGYIYADTVPGSVNRAVSSGNAYAVAATNKTITTTLRTYTETVSIDNMPPYLGVYMWQRIA